MHKQSLMAGAIFAGLAVILGAFGAHALKPILGADLLQTFETGVRYQFYHAFALLAVGIIHLYAPTKGVTRAGTFFMIGIILFSGSLYLLALLKANGGEGLGAVGILTPIGGAFFILGWIMLILGIRRK